MFNRKFMMLIGTAMIVLLMVTAPAFGFDYTDHWAGETIQKWFDEKRISGYEDGSFKPNNSITRAEFITMVNKAYGFEETAEVEFNDIDGSEWYYSEIQKSVKAGYIVGDDNEEVRPSDEVSRQEVAAVICRINNLSGSGDVSVFSDKNYIAEWAIDYVGAVASNGYMIGDNDSNFNPNNYITRAEALVALDRSIDRDVEYAVISELSIEGAEMNQAFDEEKTVYNANASQDASKIVFVADTVKGTVINFDSYTEGSEIIVSTASDIEGGIVCTAEVKLAELESTVVKITVSKKGFQDRTYSITINK